MVNRWKGMQTKACKHAADKSLREKAGVKRSSRHLTELSTSLLLPLPYDWHLKKCCQQEKNSTVDDINHRIHILTLIYSLTPISHWKCSFHKWSKMSWAKFPELFFLRTERSIVWNRMSKVINSESGLFALEIFLQKKLWKKNFKIKISSVKGD